MLTREPRPRPIRARARDHLRGVPFPSRRHPHLTEGYRPPPGVHAPVRLRDRGAGMGLDQRSRPTPVAPTQRELPRPGHEGQHQAGRHPALSKLRRLRHRFAGPREGPANHGGLGGPRAGGGSFARRHGPSDAGFLARSYTLPRTASPPCAPSRPGPGGHVRSTRLGRARDRGLHECEGGVLLARTGMESPPTAGTAPIPGHNPDHPAVFSPLVANPGRMAGGPSLADPLDVLRNRLGRGTGHHRQQEPKSVQRTNVPALLHLATATHPKTAARVMGHRNR